MHKLIANLKWEKVTQLRCSFWRSTYWEVLPLWVFSIPAHLVSTPRIQRPDHSLPEPFLRVMFAESSLEGWGIASLHKIEQVCYNRGRSLNSIFFNCDTELCTTSAPPCCPCGTWEAEKWHKHEAHDAGSAVSNKVLFLWPKSLVFAVSILRAVTGYLLSL